MAKMTVYHGGYQPVKKPEIRKGRNTKDFGYGFYCMVLCQEKVQIKYNQFSLFM